MARVEFRNGQVVIDGRPRWILGVYASGGGFSTDPAHFERQFFSDEGFGLHDIPINVGLFYTLGNMPIEPTRVLLEVLQRRGIYFLATGNCFADGSWTRLPFSIAREAYVRAFAELPGALGFYIMDECTERLLPETEAHHAQLKSWAPSLITVAALMAGYTGGEPQRTNPAHWTNAADVIGPDPYPLYGPEPAGGYMHCIVNDYVSKCRAVARPDRPVWAVLQFFKFTTDSRLPTPDEMRAHAVMAIVEGAQGILWWDIGVNGLRKGTDPATVSAYLGHLRTLVAELAGLEPLLLGADANAYLTNSTTFADPVAGRIAQLKHNIAVDQLDSRDQWYKAEIAALEAGDRSQSGGMLVGAANVRTRAFIANDTGLVAAVNYTNQTQPVTFIVPGFPPFSWSDTLGPYAARIYVIRYENGRLTIRENKSGQEYEVNGAAPAPLPPPTPEPPAAASFTVQWLYPQAGARVSGVIQIGIGTTAPWAKPKVWAVEVDGATIYTSPEAPNGSTFWVPLNLGPAPKRLTAVVTCQGETARSTIEVNP